MGHAPNILYVMADDHGANALGCYGSRLAGLDPTPTIDRLASEGVRLDRTYCTNAICTPSRASILTGQYGHLNGVKTLGDPLDPTVPHLGGMLQEAGYQTALIGKWHLYSEPTGFDHWEYLSYPGQQGRYVDPIFETSTDGTVERPGYVTDIITERSLDWLRERDRDRPFFLMCNHKAPHDFWEFADRHAERFADVAIPQPDSLFEDKSHRSVGSRAFGSSLSPGNEYRSLAEMFSQPDHVTGSIDLTGMDHRQRTRAAYRKYLRDYLRCVAAIDESVATLLDWLDEEEIADDTVVIYTSDQGMLLGEHDYSDKRWIFEESLQMPMLVRYPREIPAGTVNTDIVTNLDFAPTMLDYAGGSAPASMQGRSFRTNLAGRTPDDWPDAMYYRYWMHMAHHGVPAHYGIRTARYKLVFFYGLPLDASYSDHPPTPAGWELYDTDLDPHEIDNVYEDPTYREVVDDLKQRLADLKRHYGDTDEAYAELLDRLEVTP